MLQMVDIEYIRKKHFIEGWSIRKISRNLDIARQTVRKALQSSETPKYNLSKAKSCPVMDPYKDIIREWLEFDKTQPKKQRHTARRIFNRLCDEYDFTGSESSVRSFVRQVKDIIKEAFVPLSADWGEQAQVDWGRAKVYIDGQLTEVSLFCLRLKASLVPFVWASPTEKLEAFLEGHKLAFEWLGGVPANLVYDNPKTAVTKILKGPYREEHTQFSSLRAHYLFDSEFCNPASGHEKGTVENLVKYVRSNTMVPVPQIKSLDELNQKLLDWCERQRQLRSKEWELEHQELRLLPSAPFKCSRTHVATANRLLLFQFDRNYYSVPVECGHKSLRVEAFVDRIEVYDQTKLVTVHSRSYNRGEKIMKLEHYLPVIARKPRAAKNALVVRKLPEVYQKLRVMLCQRNPEGYREYAKILLLNMEFHFEDVLLALEESFKSGYIGLEYIRQLLISKGLKATTQTQGLAPSKLPNLDIPVDNPSKFNYLIGGVPA
ncbi:IS21 family transposase [Desulforamulus aeronauticus]|uniref:Transposase n=1 Tax=Desulforamulus aeronauticus DSM 10349 TaxID=1121421 RepID=A0A1M6XJP1_9FIRM|nr:IS21 family transposase [Desulforamulus aeronauticus]SHL06079.1 Transposase [Desulforamulus aeronauticus DSM 10349]